MLDWLIDASADVIGDALSGLFNLILGMIPPITIGIEEPFQYAIDQVILWADYAAFFLPMADLTKILFCVLLVNNFHIALWLFNWALKRIRGG